MLEIYGAIFNIHGRVGSAAVAALAFGFLAIILASFPREREDLNASTLFSEYVLVLGTLSLPFVVFVVMKITHGGLITRYCLSTVLASRWLWVSFYPGWDGRALS